MKKFFKQLIAGTLLCTTLAATTGFMPYPAKLQEKVSEVYVFGDSFSDNQGANTASKKVMKQFPNTPGAYEKPGKDYWKNRYSNGKVAVEILAESLDAKLTDYATGGATTGYGNYSDWMDLAGNTGILAQIDNHITSLKGKKADEKALYVVFGSGNDYCKLVDFKLDSTLEKTADEAISNIQTGLEKLIDAGAKKFLVPNTPAIELFPYEIDENRTKEAEFFTNYMQENLPKMLAEVRREHGVSIVEFDLTTVMREIAKAPARYNLVYTTEEALTTWPELKPVKANVDQYMFFDEWHLGRVAHKAIGTAMYHTVTNSLY